MSGYIIRRLLATILLMFGVASLVFMVIYLIPGDVAAIIGGDQASPEQIAAIRTKLGLDRPLYVQYLDWLSRVMRGDLGKSLISGNSVMTDLIFQLPRTVELMVCALLVSVSVGIPTGIFAAVRRGRVADALVSFFALIGLSMPGFVVGTLMILVFGLYLRVLPISGFISFDQDPGFHLKLLIMPSLALGLSMAGVVMRMTRSSMLEVLGEDYIRTARAKGLAEAIVQYRHALKNALIPVVSVIGVQAGSLLGGTVIIEFIFNWPGLSSLLLRGIYQRDAPLVQGVVLLISGAFVLINLAVDVVNSYLDPRIRYG
ncbi:MAG: ABC transporter permease [Chloroflexi bacterium]|nr:ABC transporter permease [Chloroflexota bacterium]